MHRSIRYAMSISVVFAAAMIGCSDAPKVDTFPVEGLVTLDGKPVAGATVMFVPVTADQGMSANGFTDEQGVYKLTAVATGDKVAEAGAGTLPGEYYVAVIKAETETPMTQEEAEEKGIEYKPPSMDKGPTQKFLVPAKYKIPKSSGLKATVKEGENKIPLELTSK